MIEAIVGFIGMALLATIGWAFEVHADVEKLKQRDEDLKEFIEARFETVNTRLDRIEQRLNERD